MISEKTLEERCKELVEVLGLGSVERVVSVEPLTGGVSSDIALVDLGTKKVCVKFALSSLKVEAEWEVSVERNQAEYLWLEFVSKISPESTPKLLGRSDSAHGFAMEFVEGEDVYLWKSSLLEGQPEREEAEKVGKTLGYIHQCSTEQLDLSKQFQNQDDFYALRIEPYLTFTSGHYPALAYRFAALIKSLSLSEFTLVHGDVSPKNIMFKEAQPIFLDAECATVGDPCFDIAFCLNHLVLKAVHMSEFQQSRLKAVNRFWHAYKEFVSWEPVVALEQRVCGLLPALMLARIDGKSPVEYFSEENQQLIRKLAIDLLKIPSTSLNDLTERVQHFLERQ